MTAPLRTGRTARRRLTAPLLPLVVPLLLLGGCTDDGSSTPKGSDTMTGSTPAAPTAAALPAAPPEGRRLCDFVPAESAETMLGTHDLQAAGRVTGAGTDGLVAECKVHRPGSTDPLVFVHVERLTGAARSIFERDLTSSERHQLPDAAGLGYSWTDPAGYRDGSTGPVSETWLLHGSHLVQTSVWSPPRSRPAEQDTVSLARQVVATLDLPDGWTLGGQAPVR